MKKLPIALVAVLVVLVAAIGWSWRELSDQREHNAAQRARLEAVEMSGAVVQVPVRDDAPALSSTPDAVAAEVADGANAGGSTGDASTKSTSASVRTGAARGDERASDALAASIQQTLSTEAGREFARTMLRNTLTQRLPNLAKELNISDAEAERLLDLLAKQQSDIGADRVRLLQGGNLDADARNAALRQIAQQEQAHEAELSAMLGANYDKLKEYQRTAATRMRETMARQQSLQLRNAVSSSASPLTDASFAAFQAAVTAEQGVLDREARNLSLAQRVEGLAKEQQRLTEVAAIHLNAEQLERYRRHLRQQADMMRMSSGMLEAVTPSPAPRP